MARLQLAEPGGRRARHFLKKGDIVRYEKFGLGVVTEDEHEGMVSASFDGQVKRLSLQYVPIVRVSGEDERERRESTFHQETDDEHEGHVHGSHWDPFYAEFDELIGNLQDVVNSGIMDAFFRRLFVFTRISGRGDRVA